ncbi:MAG: anthranilate synthase component I family protein [bacterium]|nr:anthranilate synthase component I family protein [Candidatus Kapabacteria bacterium]
MNGPYPDLEGFRARSVKGARLPVVLDVTLDNASPQFIYQRFRERFGNAVLLESGKGGRYTYIGLAEQARFVVDGDSIELPDGRSVAGDPFNALRELLASETVIANERVDGFCGGYVGYLAYDMARHIERIPALTVTSPVIPDCHLVRVTSFCEIDHESRIARFVSSGTVDDEADALYRRVCDDLTSMRDAAFSAQSSDGVRTDEASTSHVVTGHIGEEQPMKATSSLSQSQFEGAVRAAKSYIRAGDIFQVNLSVRFEQPYTSDPLQLYTSLRRINPAPYMALLEFGRVAVVSASPELLIRVRNRVIETRPIAGTRPRGANEQEDERNARKLSENEKERAEHLMMVDLERNDIGRVARYGSVRVDELMGIERYSHVIHIVSHVRGELADGRDTIDAIRSVFPGGTITGAPKVRSMEIIEELEPQRRGVYTGSIGWIGFDGNAELNIAIRTIVIVDGVAYAQAGAGIVADSEPVHEYTESVRKATAALQALSEASQ